MTSYHPALDAFYAAQERLELIQRQAQNSPRQATQAIRHRTDGTGEIILPSPLMFDVAFLQEPDFASGTAIIRPPDLTQWQYPIANAGVVEWVYEGELVVGASMYFVVQCLSRTLDPPVVAASPALMHSLVFTGMAMKKLPGEVFRELDASMTPRSTFGQ
jgi:hypothetical protein